MSIIWVCRNWRAIVLGCPPLVAHVYAHSERMYRQFSALASQEMLTYDTTVPVRYLRAVPPCLTFIDNLFDDTAFKHVGSVHLHSDAGLYRHLTRLISLANEESLSLQCLAVVSTRFHADALYVDEACVSPLGPLHITYTLTGQAPNCFGLHFF